MAKNELVNFFDLPDDVQHIYRSAMRIPKGPLLYPSPPRDASVRHLATLVLPNVTTPSTPTPSQRTNPTVFLRLRIFRLKSRSIAYQLQEQGHG
jgi:hypothetical protein